MIKRKDRKYIYMIILVTYVKQLSEKNIGYATYALDKGSLYRISKDIRVYL